IALRMGLYQLLHLDRIPPHAAVSESVELVKIARKRSAAGVVNAILRKVKKTPNVFPDQATALSVPAWMVERWRHAYGETEAQIIALSFLQPPQAYYRAGRQQDIGSQSVVPLLRLEPGQLFLDLCAAPGNKTSQALETSVQAVACDLHLHRLRSMPDPGCPLVNLDATQPLPFRRIFDRILVDAPCSGTGTLGRNPEIKWRLQPADLIDLHHRQVKILTNALTILKPGGILVYSTCSLEEEENEAVVRKVLGRNPDETHRRLPGVQPGDGFFAAVIRSD
ncbi:MAG TPA: transcription antitermination factor NusB, partial [Bryobacteraceae bacterium]|nr:transcription antitermination factor NusB [Bryobacteraceae bacterium]